MSNTPDLDNYREYNKGKAKLQNAIFIPKDDKIQAFMKKNTKHRFWVNDYNSFKKSMNEDTGVAGLAPGEGNPIAPTPNSLGSGDKFQSEKPKKKDKKINESFGDSIESFSYPLTYSDIFVINEPSEFGDVRITKATINYLAEIEHNKFGIEGIIFVIQSILFEAEMELYAADDINGDNPMNEKRNFNIEKPENVKIEVNTLPFYPVEMTVDMKKNSTDPKAWSFDISFGRDHNSY